MESPVIHVAAGVCLRERRILITRRSPKMSAPGLWEFPGGKVEPGESPREALIRELKEELCLAAAPGVKLGESRIPFRSGHLRMECFHVALEKTEEPVLLEHDGMSWITTEDFGAYHWGPADVPLVEDPAFIERVKRLLLEEGKKI